MLIEDALRDALYRQVALAITAGCKNIGTCILAIDPKTGNMRWGPETPEIKAFYRAKVSVVDGRIRIDSFNKVSDENLN